MLANYMQSIANFSRFSSRGTQLILNWHSIGCIVAVDVCFLFESNILFKRSIHLILLVCHGNFHLNYDEIQSKTWCSIFAKFSNKYRLKIHQNQLNMNTNWFLVKREEICKFNHCQYGKLPIYNRDGIYALALHT